MNNKIYKLNMNKFTGYVNYVNPSIKDDLNEDRERLFEVFDSMKHTQPEYIFDVLTPAIHYIVSTWLQIHGFHVDRSRASIISDYGKDLIKYSKFLSCFDVMCDLEEDEHE